jgi:outer membrane protein assembly factor BamB
VPAVVDGHIYVGSADGHLYAIDFEGTEIWRAALGAPVNSSPAVADGRVYAQTRTGYIVAVSAAHGLELWRRATGPNALLDWGFESGDIYTSSPLVLDDVVGSGG